MRKIALILSSLIPLAWGCAQQVAPTGGIKDIIPPELLESVPPNKAVNFKEKVITMTFDEYVVIDNLMQKLIITPQVENPYTPRVNGQSVELKFKNTFPDSTTFTLNFGDGIKDFAERNPAKNLKLVFSTGPSIDSGSVYGVVKDIVTNKPVFDALVGLYTLSDTLTPEKIKPYYFSRTDSSGVFVIENTQLDRYALIALTDKNRNLLYNPKEDNIAFLDSTIQVGADSAHYHLYTFRSDISPIGIQRTIPKVNSYTMVFNKNVDSVMVKFENEEETLPYFVDGPTQLKFYNRQPALDSLQATITVRDSLGYEKDFKQKISFLKQRGKEVPKDPFSATIQPDRNSPVTQKQLYRLQFNKPVDSFRPDSIRFRIDSIPTSFKSELLDFQWNTFKTQLFFEVDSKAKDSLSIEFPKGTFFGVENDTLPPLAIRYEILKPDDYGIIRGKIVNQKRIPFILELVDSENKVAKTTRTDTFTFDNIKPGTYTMRLIIDSNNNGKWDTGDYPKRRQPERILFYPTPLDIKSNFEYEDTYFTIE